MVDSLLLFSLSGRKMRLPTGKKDEYEIVLSVIIKFGVGVVVSGLETVLVVTGSLSVVIVLSLVHPISSDIDKNKVNKSFFSCEPSS